MGTINNYDEEFATLAHPLQPTDLIPVHEAASGIKKSLSGAQIMQAASGIVNTVATSVTLAVTADLHAGKIIGIANSTPTAISLPAATGTGNHYAFVFNVAATATASTIARATSTDVFQGVALILATASIMSGFQTTATDNTMTFNGTSKGGVVGDLVEFWDIKSGVFEVKYRSGAAVAPATPFSHT